VKAKSKLNTKPAEYFTITNQRICQKRYYS